MTTFGREALDLWHLDQDFAYLNHGTVGATPIHILERQRAWIDKIERHPARLMLRELSDPFDDWTGTEPPLMRQAAAAVAAYVGAPGGSAIGDDDGDVASGLALVDNITTGANAVLRSLELGPDDIVALTTVGYGGVDNAAKWVAERAGATVDVIELPGPGAKPAEFSAAFKAQLRPGTKLAVVDHLSAFSALVLPVADFIATCRANDTLVLVDAAHVPGQLELDLSNLGGAGSNADHGSDFYPDFYPDFYTANLHKWGWNPRSSGFLWVAPQHREWVHPTVISWGIGKGLAAEFDLLGTKDPSAFLVFQEVLEYRATFGEEAIRSYNHELCWSSANHLAGVWGMPFDTPEEMIGSMAVVRLPERLGSTSDDAERVRKHLDENCKVEVPIFAIDELPGLVVRFSTQIYNDTSDIERLAEGVNQAPEANRP